MEAAFNYDFNIVVEDFPFYHQITPKMQTELIQSTRLFREFEKSFNHFFEECERGFTNEMVIQMYCQIYPPGKIVINNKTNVKEIYFIKQGMVEVFNNEHDDKEYQDHLETIKKYDKGPDGESTRPQKNTY